VAPPRHCLVGGDFSQIEARVAAWLGGEDWKLEAFRRGRDVYCETASGILGRTVTKADDPEGRQIGKVAELAFGFGGGLNAWRQWDKLASDEAVFAYRDGWRANHPGIVATWALLNNAAIEVVTTGGNRRVGHVTLGMETIGVHRYMFIQLPSGRRLRYFEPSVREKRAPWDPEKTITAVHYQAQKTGRWMEVDTYGGKLFENIVQAVARDIMVDAMFHVDNAMGMTLQPVLTVHDEIIWQTYITEISLNKIKDLLTTAPAWMPGLPVDVDLWKGDRYGK